MFLTVRAVFSGVLQDSVQTRGRYVNNQCYLSGVVYIGKYYYLGTQGARTDSRVGSESGYSMVMCIGMTFAVDVDGLVATHNMVTNT